jgi:ribosomal-protein-alanine N-acetyltransferase
MALSDIEEVYRINQEVILNPWTKEAIIAEVEQWMVYSKVLEHENKAIGYIFVRNLYDVFEITSFAVLKAYQGQGWGKKLLREIVQEAKNSKNIKGLLLEVNEVNQVAIALYLSQGFQKTRLRERYYRDGSNAVEMYLDLT